MDLPDPVHPTPYIYVRGGRGGRGSQCTPSWTGYGRGMDGVDGVGLELIFLGGVSRWHEGIERAHQRVRVSLPWAALA